MVTDTPIAGSEDACRQQGKFRRLSYYRVVQSISSICTLRMGGCDVDDSRLLRALA
jgi:hypothetical protein